ncbi:LytTR family DNA-binding domain-containing protein [Guyparkeria sp. GHLCS8-2]|uniref:LytR/AlgR family response regulator transcription factor n=1 Tax=Guyparkeria halopsychrophila TaxID=3139421 RepID=UPI0037C739EC
MMRALIVDDEPLARDRLRRLLGRLGGIEVIGEAGNADEARAAMRQVPDLVFLDIEMPGEDGIQLAHDLRKADLPPAIVFTTAHADHALPASETAPAGYLLKPIEPAALCAAIERAGRPNRCHQADRPTLTVRLGREELRLGPEHLVAAIAEDKATHLYLLDPADGRRREAWIEPSLNELEERFDGQLLRLHRNSLVNAAQIHSVSHHDGQHRCHVHHIDEPLVISRRAWRSVRDALGQ